MIMQCPVDKCMKDIEVPDNECWDWKGVCPHCNQAVRIDWDYSGDDSQAFWLIEDE